MSCIFSLIGEILVNLIGEYSLYWCVFLHMYLQFYVDIIITTFDIGTVSSFVKFLFMPAPYLYYTLLPTIITIEQKSVVLFITILIYLIIFLNLRQSNI